MPESTTPTAPQVTPVPKAGAKAKAKKSTAKASQLATAALTAKVRADKVRTEGETVKARKARHQRNATPPVVDAPPADAPPEAAPQAATNRVERVALAKAEHKALQAWIKDGEKPPRPATPNLDALNAENAAGGPKPKAPSTPRPAAAGPYADALAAKKAAKNKRGPGTKASADELAAVAAELRAQGLTQGQGLEVAYWLRKLAVSRGTWAKAWEASAAAA